MITFKSIRWKNFLSTGNYFTSIDITKRSTTLIAGENGAGKSTVLDALTYCLFGRSFRGINIPQLINSVNDKDCIVEIEFEIGDNEYLVRRGQKPKVFEIHKNQKLIDQNSNSKDYQSMLEEQILKMSYRSFCQVIVLGSSNYIPFMRLSTSDRRAVVETLLDIDIFSAMNTIIKARLSQSKDSIKDIDYKVDIVRTKIETQERLIKDIQSRSDDAIEAHKTEISDSEKDIDRIEKEITDIESKIEKLLDTSKDKAEVQTAISDTKASIRDSKRDTKSLQESIGFYENNDKCPACSQKIDSDHKDKMIKGMKKTIESQNKEQETLKDKLDGASARLDEIEEILSAIRVFEEEIRTRRGVISASKKYIGKLKTDIQRTNDERGKIEEEKDAMKALAVEGKDLVCERMSLIKDKHNYEIASLLLKDTGIKAKIIKHYLPIMNKLINQYLKSMEFFVMFELDENFNETIKSRHRDEFSYHNFSEGERLRIDLSLLLAWREVATLRNSTNCNLLILDEVFDSSLDAVGTDEFLKILRGFGKNNNIFVISHKSDQLHDKFDGTIRFEKKNNFSKICK